MVTGRRNPLRMLSNAMDFRSRKKRPKSAEFDRMAAAAAAAASSEAAAASAVQHDPSGERLSCGFVYDGSVRSLVYVVRGVRKQESGHSKFSPNWGNGAWARGRDHSCRIIGLTGQNFY